MKTWDPQEHPRDVDGTFATKPHVAPAASTVLDASEAALIEAAASETTEREAALRDYLDAHLYDPGAPEAVQAHRWRELYRLRSDLADSETKLCGELAELVGEGSVVCDDGTVARVKIGRPRDEWATETLWHHVSEQAAARQAGDSSLTEEEALCDAARSYLAAGGYKTDGLRGLGLRPADFATYTPRTTEDGTEIEILVPTEMEPSTDQEQSDRAEIARLYAGASMTNRPPKELAERIREIQAARSKVEAVQNQHATHLLNQLPKGKPTTYPGVGTLIRRTDGYWQGWDHDKLWTHLQHTLQERAPQSAGPQARRAAALKRLREVISDGAAWRKKPLKAANLLDQVHMTRRGRVRVTFEP